MTDLQSASTEELKAAYELSMQKDRDKAAFEQAVDAQSKSNMEELHTRLKTQAKEYYEAQLAMLDKFFSQDAPKGRIADKFE